MLEIAPDKVAHVIVKAREYDAKVGTWDDTARSGDAEDDPSSILEDYANDPTRAELAAFIDGLNVDEQVNLVALAWRSGSLCPMEDSEDGQHWSSTCARSVCCARSGICGPQVAMDTPA